MFNCSQERFQGFCRFLAEIGQLRKKLQRLLTFNAIVCERIKVDVDLRGHCHSSFTMMSLLLLVALIGSSAAAKIGFSLQLRGRGHIDTVRESIK